ncbi:hypothetical protein HK097_002473 [Rhizophlyctis rosea]|uniref:Uncharacterized protein n=1 Tax=Rhizophlyctis rosea TaxID=64517 RepID=A0AAD5S5Y5_9FUNG|nr:hypothetical protein HK097_002473 [Rhizophlyctis rosea]
MPRPDGTYSYGRSGRGYHGGAAGGAGGHGRGRGAYYKEKYGGGRSREQRNDSVSNLVEPTTTGPESIRNISDLVATLHSIDRSGYGAYKEIKGAYSFPNGVELRIDNVQSDPYAPPSKMRVRVPQQLAGFPDTLYSSRIRRIALEHYITRAFWNFVHSEQLDVAHKNTGWSGSKGADFNIDKPGQQVLERSSVDISREYVEAKFTLGLPAQGRNILGRQAVALLMEQLPRIVNTSMMFQAFNVQDVTNFVNCIEDQEALRRAIKEAGLIAFIRNGAILPRQSGASDLPMQTTKTIPFQTPQTLSKTFKLPNRGTITGMAIPAGITLIAGGGFHGKSTLLDALQLGVYNHVPGDGREFVVADQSLMKIRAEDGRSVKGVDISPFIGVLPFGQGTERFSTADASGSTSMAANIQEALETGCTGFLFDEDTCATNFLIRDLRMQMLISKENEPITPLISKIRSLYTEQNCSSILVVGGSGSYLDVADLVISMESYVPNKS